MSESVVYAIKVTLVISASLAFVVAINYILSLVVTFASTTALGEIVGLISVYLPFSPAPFFGTLLLACSSILAFLLAQRVYQILVNVQSAS